MSKTELHLIENPFDVKQLIKLYANMTGKKPTADEVEAVKKMFAGGDNGLTVKPKQRS